MIYHEGVYLEFIARRGVGKKDTVPGASQRSYVSYLNGASEKLGLDISPHTLATDEALESLVKRIDAMVRKRAVNSSTGNHYKTALRRYREMIAAHPELQKHES